VGKTHDDTAHAHCRLDTQGYNHTLTICNTHCFPLQQWLHEGASLLRYTYIACIVGYEMEVMVMTDDMEGREECK
jgi:hypothetical protein